MVIPGPMIFLLKNVSFDILDRMCPFCNTVLLVVVNQQDFEKLPFDQMQPS